MSSIVTDEKSDTLRDALARLVVSLHPLDGLKAVILVDPAPCFVSLRNTNALQHLGVSAEFGCVKNINKSLVAEKVVKELGEKLLLQKPSGGPINELGLAVATAHLNTWIRSQGLSSYELWTQQNQLTTWRHNYNEITKGGQSPFSPTVPPLQVEDLVLLYSDRDKLCARADISSLA